MPDEPAAMAQLEAAVNQVRRVFAGRPGSPDWGDALPHHPDQRPGMSDDAIRALHRRPVDLPASELSWAEVDYFFGHAAWTPKPEETQPPAFRYFLPRLAEATLRPHPPDGSFALDPWVLFERLDLVGWQKWSERERHAISGWLSAWGAALICWQSESWGPYGYELQPDDPKNRNLEDCFGPILAAVDFARLEHAFDRLDALGWVRFIRGLLPADDLGILSIPVERRRPLLKRIAEGSLEEVVLTAPRPEGADPVVWQDTCLACAVTIGNLRQRAAAEVE